MFVRSVMIHGSVLANIIICKLWRSWCVGTQNVNQTVEDFNRFYCEGPSKGEGGIQGLCEASVRVLG